MQHDAAQNASRAGAVLISEDSALKVYFLFPVKDPVA